MIELSGLTKIYDSRVILDDISATFDNGMIHGIVGRNGTGKSLLFKMIVGLAKPTKGYVAVDGLRIGKDVEFAPDIGFLIDPPLFFQQFTGLENLLFLARIRKSVGVDEAKRAIQSVGLNSSERVGKYSLGMRQQLGIAQAIMENPNYIILDEPMNALDDVTAEMTRRLLIELKEKRKTILLASHIMSDITRLCDTVHEIKGKKLIRLRGNA